MSHTPKIDYTLIGEAVRFYTDIGYRYVEVPWIVTDYAIHGTLPEGADFMKVGIQHPNHERSDLLQTYYDGESALVGSAEQGFITMGLEPGQYVGVTPCFRCETHHDLFYQDTFMKVELFDNRSSSGTRDLLKDAKAFFIAHADAGLLKEVDTAIGTDLQLGGIEIGSYGERAHEDFGRWVYGTGLALPRFDVAKALSRIF